MIAAFLRNNTQIMEDNGKLDTLLQSLIQKILCGLQIARGEGLNTSSDRILWR